MTSEIAGLFALMALLGFAGLSFAFRAIRCLERELDEERKERRELGYKVQEQQFEANRCYELLGLRREPKRDAEWRRAS